MNYQNKLRKKHYSEKYNIVRTNHKENVRNGFLAAPFGAVCLFFALILLLVQLYSLNLKDFFLLSFDLNIYIV